jgi:hypothetical protein
MSTQSFDGLCQSMQGKSITRGWDAVVTMSRAKVNRLLEQQYINRFRNDNFLKKISGEHSIFGYAVLELDGLVLSQPRLSFENANLANSKARLTFDVEAGMVSRRFDGPNLPSRVTSSFVVTPQQGYKVYADIDLMFATGLVEEDEQGQGQVIIDLGKAYDFTSNLVEESMDQIALGNLFHKVYASYPPAMRTYKLGMLDFDADDLLVPREFQIRTHKAPQDNAVLSEDGEGGAVVLFVRTRNNPSNGSTPGQGSDFPYLIPDDLDPGTGQPIYSGSLVLASRVVFDWFLEPYLMQTVGNDLRVQREVLSNHVARSLRAVSGGISLKDFNYKHVHENSITHISAAVKNEGPFKMGYYHGDSTKALRFSANQRFMFDCSWFGHQPVALRFTQLYVLGIGNRDYPYTGYGMPKVKFELAPVVDAESNAVTFEREPGHQFSVDSDWMPPDYEDQTPRWIFESLRVTLEGVTSRLVDGLKRMALPAINVFHINHLLFPEKNALRLTKAALPGDLFLAGHIDPTQVSATLEPLFGRVRVGEQLAFDLKTNGEPITDVTWRVRAVDGSRATGDISDDGTFTAPTAEMIDDLAVRNVVTVSYKNADTGAERFVSAMVVVVADPMTVTPSMFTIDMESSGRDPDSSPVPVKLKVTLLKEEKLKWTLRGPGELHETGDEATYTQPEAISEALLPIEIEVEGLTSGNKVFATIILLNSAFTLPVAPALHPGLPAKAVTQLRVDNEEDNSDVVWSMVTKEGRIDPVTGAYTAPDEIRSPYAVILAATGTSPRAHRGYSLIRLSNYARQSKWKTLDFFRLTTDSLTTWTTRNGRQQVTVIVEVRPNDVDGVEVDVSDEELASIQLVTEGGEPINMLGRDGVPPKPESPGEAWDAWGYTDVKNEFDQYQGPAMESLPALAERSPNGRRRTFYVQTRADAKLKIAAYMRGDNGLPYYSNEKGGSVADKRVIEITPERLPDFSNSAYTMERKRVKGQENNDVYLDTIDYYYLGLTSRGRVIDFRTIEFKSMKSIVQWESRQFEEDICSFTGYALAQSSVLNVDQNLYLRMPNPAAPAPGEVDKRVRPDKTVVKGFECPPGKFLISLHRSQYWKFDLGCEPDYTKGLALTIFDKFGNEHRVKVNFRSEADRNTLVAEKQ